MPATPLPAVTRYLPPGRRKFYWLTAIANPGAPTRAELNAGTDVSPQVSTVTGFNLVTDTVDVTPLGSSFVTLLPTTVDAAIGGVNELLFYAASNSQDVRTVFPIGTTGYIVFLYEGDVATQLCEVWPAVVNAMYFEQDKTLAGSIHVQFTITSQPSQNVTIPT